jgi:osmotically-inducible protein OsmY
MEEQTMRLVKADGQIQQDVLEHAVRYLIGVHGVANDVVVRTPAIAAATVRRMIEEALERRAEREAGHLKIGVDGGRVTLTGRVQSWAERQAILGAVSHAPGVSEVRDEVQVGMVG